MALTLNNTKVAYDDKQRNQIIPCMYQIDLFFNYLCDVQKTKQRLSRNFYVKIEHILYTIP